MSSTSEADLVQLVVSLSMETIAQSSFGGVKSKINQKVDRITVKRREQEGMVDK